MHAIQKQAIVAQTMVCSLVCNLPVPVRVRLSARMIGGGPDHEAREARVGMSKVLITLPDKRIAGINLMDLGTAQGGDK